MFLSDGSPLIARQTAFDNITDRYTSLAKDYAELLDSLKVEEK